MPSVGDLVDYELFRETVQTKTIGDNCFFSLEMWKYVLYCNVTFINSLLFPNLEFLPPYNKPFCFRRKMTAENSFAEFMGIAIVWFSFVLKIMFPRKSLVFSLEKIDLSVWNYASVFI